MSETVSSGDGIWPTSGHIDHMVLLSGDGGFRLLVEAIQSKGVREVNEALVRQLRRCEFMQQAENVVLVGGPETGNSHIATALAVSGHRAASQESALLRHRRTRQRAAAGKGAGKSRQIAERLVRCDLIILDERRQKQERKNPRP